jgi:para-aminobenzoate synthetase/4-amino-4-deoxychorismate lyase
LSISSVFIVLPHSLRSSQAVTVDGPLSTAHLPRPDPTRGVFETLLVVNGRPVELDAHLDRLAASVRELFGAPTMARVSDPARVLAEARARELAPAANGVIGASPALARLRLTLAPDDRGALDLSTTAVGVDPATVFPGDMGGSRLEAIVVPGGLGGHKWADRRLLDQASTALDGAVPLIADTDATVLEAERANVFAVQDGALLTPPADGRILPGVARARVIAIARELGIAAYERLLSLDDLAEADELFLSGSVRGIEPFRPGPTTARIADELRRHWLP